MYDNNNNPFDPSEIFDKVQAQLCKNDFCISAVPAQVQGTKEQVILAVVTSSQQDETFSSINSESALFVFNQSPSVTKKLFLREIIPITPENIVRSSTKSIEMRLPKNVENDDKNDDKDNDDEEEEVKEDGKTDVEKEKKIEGEVMKEKEIENSEKGEETNEKDDSKVKEREKLVIVEIVEDDSEKDENGDNDGEIKESEEIKTKKREKLVIKEVIEDDDEKEKGDSDDEGKTKEDSELKNDSKVKERKKMVIVEIVEDDEKENENNDGTKEEESNVEKKDKTIEKEKLVAEDKSEKEENENKIDKSNANENSEEEKITDGKNIKIENNEKKNEIENEDEDENGEGERGKKEHDEEKKQIEDKRESVTEKNDDNLNSDEKTIVYESTIINTFTESFFGKIILKKSETGSNTTKKTFRWTKKYNPMRSVPENPKLKITDVTVFLGTWNVNSISPPQSLHEWLGAGFEKSDRGYPDIYCVGFQELDMSANALILGNVSKVRPWEDAVYKTISAYETYELVHSRNLVGIFLCVFVKSNLNGLISGMRSDSIASGLLGVMGNKGGVGIRFNINDSSCCIVNCHLNAYMDNVIRRNQDYHEIESKMAFMFRGRQISIWDHDFLFWMGDMNYRVEEDDEKVRQYIKDGNYEWLLSHDQLREQMEKKLAFDPFLEPPITFPPTYKYIKNTNEYVPIAQNRIPAYCDRVLWKSAEGEGIVNTSYRRHELLGSDHRPVSATFVIKAKSGVADAKVDMRVKRRRHIDEKENELSPSASLSTNEVNFENLEYEKRKVIPVLFRNNNRVPFKWFIESCKKESAPKWLTVNPESGTLDPDEECVINFKAYIDQYTAKDLCEPKLGCNMIDEIYILHLESGRDYFISVIGTYLRSCFGMAISQLIHYRSSVKLSEPDAESRMWVPKELWRLVDFIITNSLDTPDLFGGTTPERISQIREVLDTDVEIDKEKFSSQDVAAGLLAFLAALHEPIISEKMYILFDRFSEKETKRNVDNNQGDPKYSSLYYIMSLLRMLISHNKKNNITKEKLAKVFYTPLTHLKLDATKTHIIEKLI